jgi:S-adenosylmethionine decarboxylase
MNQEPDHFKQSADGQPYAGDHLLVEFWGASNLSDPETIRTALESSALAAGATLLHSHYHRFGDGGGVSGVSVLAESHITIHTWPERGYAAIDIFMCGNCDPHDCLPDLERYLCPNAVEVQSLKRGRCNPADAVKNVA